MTSFAGETNEGDAVGMGRAGQGGGGVEHQVPAEVCHRGREPMGFHGDAGGELGEALRKVGRDVGHNATGITGGDGSRNGACGDSICIMLPMDSRRVLRRLEADGWYVHRIVGSHHQMKHPDKSGTITVPHPRKDLKIGTILSIEKQSGIKLRR